jgi:hypothetical protein
MKRLGLQRLYTEQDPQTARLTLLSTIRDILKVNGDDEMTVTPKASIIKTIEKPDEDGLDEVHLATIESGFIVYLAVNGMRRGLYTIPTNSQGFGSLGLAGAQHDGYLTNIIQRYFK